MAHVERDNCQTCEYWIGAIVQHKLRGGDYDIAKSLGDSLHHHILDYFSIRATEAERGLANVLEHRLAVIKDQQEHDDDAAGVAGDDR